MHQAFGYTDPPVDMSPIAVAKGFTTQFIMNPDVSTLEKKITDSFNRLNRKHPMLIVEGTGHAGVGSCFGLSNARVAQMLDANVIIVSSGGIGRPIDEIAMSLALVESVDFRDKLHSGGLILTGGLKPDSTILSLLLKSNLPVLITNEDTFTVTAKMKDLHFKIRADDTDKIARTYNLLKGNVNIDAILSALDR